MNQHNVETLEELEFLIQGLGVDVLFRGQNSHYGSPSEPSVVTSFDRKGCIPSQMLKWSRYAKNVLDVFLKERQDNLAYKQALLQHYGWRSFYIDCSSNPAVGAWFASHKYSDELTVEMSEDYEEEPIILRKLKARYDFEEGVGHLYVLDKSAAGEVGVVDLSDIAVEGRRPRTVAQAAWLVGPIRTEALPQGCFRARISASRALLRDYAKAHGIHDTSHLFPPVSDDPILKALLGLPWEEINGIRTDDFPISAFKRALELPEYENSYVKFHWPHTAFFCGAKVSTALGRIDGAKYGGVIVDVPIIVLYGLAPENLPLKFPFVEKLIEDKSSVAFEVDELVQHIQMSGRSLYQKGVGVLHHGNGLYEVCELLVEHPGQNLKAAGFNRGLHYQRQNDGVWKRVAHEEDCDCGDENLHKMHLSALHLSEKFLENPKAFED